MVRVAQISDTHIGITTEGQLKKMFRELKKEEFDILVHCGDYCGTTNGAKCVARTVKLMREFFPDKPILSTIGNHEYYCNTNKRVPTKSPTGRTTYVKPAHPTLLDFHKNLEGIQKVFKDANIHYLDKDGIYIHPNFHDVIFIGASGWYTNPNPRTNDKLWMPIGIDGDTNRYLLKSTESDLFSSEAELAKIYEPYKTVVFVSHFPVIKAGNDYKGAFEEFSWSEAIGNFFIREYNCKYFLNGHAHQLHKGPLRYECGPDYCKPAYQIIDI
jgi:hypothetical protein